MEPSPHSTHSHTSHSQDTPGTHQISCVNCRKRKIKCNRVEPCGPCERVGVECIFRARAPRSQRRGGKDSQSRETELLLRLSRLEGLVSKIDPAAIRDARRGNDDNLSSPPVQQDISFSENALVAEVSTKEAEIDHRDDDPLTADQFSQFVQQQEHWSRHTNSSFWKNLSEEINGLREILEEPLEDRDDEDDLAPLSSPKHSPPYFIL